LGKDFCGQPSTLWIVVLPLQALWGDTDAAFEWLERANHQRDAGLAEVKAAHSLMRLHSDPRWKAFIRKGAADRGSTPILRASP